MATVHLYPAEKPVEVDDTLLSDMLFTCLVVDKAVPLYVYLASLDPEPREQLAEYIVHRLAEVNPGHLEVIV